MTQYGNVVRLRSSTDSALQPRASGEARDAEIVGPTQVPTPDQTCRVDLGTVVPFVRPRRDDTAIGAAPKLDIAADSRPAPVLGTAHTNWRLVALFLCSAMIHEGLYAVLNREPRSMAGIEIEAISVELVPVPDTPAPPAPTLSEPERPQAAADNNAPPLETEAATTDVGPPPGEPKIAPDETIPEAETRLASRPLPDQPPEPAPAPPGELTKPPEPDRPKPPEKPAVQEPGAGGKRHDPARNHSAAKEPPDAKQSTLKLAARPLGGLGPGRSDADTNYRELVAAHFTGYALSLAARHQGQTGNVVVTFGLDGGGRVTSVAVVRGSGVPGIDQEVQATVRRASPFPAPPSGRPVTFTRQVNFRRSS